MEKVPGDTTIKTSKNCTLHSDLLKAIINKLLQIVNNCLSVVFPGLLKIISINLYSLV